ncbi:YlcI/YnfO family protein [Arthrobacter stackebrandtii]|uniref:YlcI/YnfO family protein n=1 Tax=Arthrobacter stackebrandtii TaxID=272161 RepID=UPI000D956B78|nr:YlcI/YnfO family protein [Arthrobacter stackebrandtii]PYH00591.1 CopG family transcriptional regulator [Arthrobacter stackebrandtii]
MSTCWSSLLLLRGTKPQEVSAHRLSCSAKLSEPVPVRFPEELLKRVRDEAAADGRSVSNWIRRAVENELSRRVG